jgi:hypothetical protein
MQTATGHRRGLDRHVLAIGVALLLTVVLIAVRATTAAFTSTTANAANSWSAGTVALTDDDSGTAMFAATAMAPGDAVTRCITVSYSGSVDAAVRLYGSITGGTGLGTYLNLTVERGAGGSFADCTGFVSAESVYTGTLAGFTATHTGFANGAGTWSPVGGAPVDTMTYRFTTTLQDDNAAQGLSATAAFTWEAQST